MLYTRLVGSLIGSPIDVSWVGRGVPARVSGLQVFTEGAEERAIGTQPTALPGQSFISSQHHTFPLYWVNIPSVVLRVAQGPQKYYCATEL